MEGLGRFLHGQFIFKAPLPTTDLTGQTIIVTGANSGLGFAAAGHFARLNAQLVILACRSLEKGEAARTHILKDTGRDARAVEVWELDVSSFESVIRFGARVNQQLGRLDAVLANAAIHATNYRLAEGMESTVTVNVVSQVLLALMVIPKLRESADKYGIRPRLTMVGSAVHYWTKFTERKAMKVAGKGGRMGVLEALNDTKTANMPDRYYLSKLLILMLWTGLAAEMGGTKVVLNVVEPGLCHSNLFRDLTTFDSFPGALVFRLVAR